MSACRERHQRREEGAAGRRSCIVRGAEGEVVGAAGAKPEDRAERSDHRHERLDRPAFRDRGDAVAYAEGAEEPGEDAAGEGHVPVLRSEGPEVERGDGEGEDRAEEDWLHERSLRGSGPYGPLEHPFAFC